MLISFFTVYIETHRVQCIWKWGAYMQTMKVPFSNITELKKSPTKLFEEAKSRKTGVYVFNRDQPAGVVLAVADYEELVNQNEELQDRLFELEQDYVVSQRLIKQEKENKPLMADKTVRGPAADDVPIIDENDGWEWYGNQWGEVRIGLFVGS